MNKENFLIDQSWNGAAKCSKLPPDEFQRLFYPKTTGSNQAVHAEAKSHCDPCRAKPLCLTAAIDREDIHSGVRAGFTPGGLKRSLQSRRRKKT